MQIILIGSIPIYLHTLAKALSAANFNVETYTEENLSEEPLKLADLVIYVLNDVKKPISLNIQCPLYVLKPQTKELEENFNSKNTQILDMPVRLGHLCQQIREFFKLEEHKEGLKPLKMGRFIFLPSQMKLKEGENTINLTDKERDILLCLSRAGRSSLSRQNLLDNVWGYASGVETHTLETHIYRLRQKIEKIPSKPELLMINDNGYYLSL